MNIVVEKQPKCVATLRVEIPAEKVLGRRKEIVQTFAGKARVPGFRPGKAPQSIIEKRFEKEIREELNERLFNEAFDAALEQENLKVLDFGAPDNVVDLPGGGLSFISKVTLAPEIELPEYKGIKVTVPPAELPQADIDAHLQTIRERFADFQTVENRPAAAGDFAVIDFTSSVDGQPTEEFLGRSAGFLAGREGYWVRLDEKAFLPGFASQVEGMNPGESRDITLTLPDDFPVEELRNKPITFATSLKELKEAILPELNDEFAAKLLPGKSMAEITDLIVENMREERKRQIDDMKVNQILEHLTSLASFEIPEDLVTRETQSQADSMVERGVQAGMTEEEIQARQEEIFTTAGQRAAASLRSNFLLQEIARVEKIAVSDAELVTHLVRVAESKGIQPKKFIRDLQRSGRLLSTRTSLAIGKTIDFLVEHAEVVEAAEAAISEE